ncbi:hypothetical protein BGW36DRAFT_386741 [Talaromyces proteolyticus]|uniref:Zn(2)-C6 fungal-type domain-containing protein n=1 Tax=Talaromyces proteolyticus TaxID=1131652 RepID=A0AAD4KH23_9EURO|nr:uncharacterized protein BGW36DRAFT_386741 [Talaromyces proteolyticus]KAH8691984.1 hypothetical protein BGW36DRAFT_386741 [Talaromyces proteolyticus]
MPRSISGELQRAPQPKTKSGCLTCKRVKCDEAKPNCLRCSSTGRKCDGYQKSSPRSLFRDYQLPLYSLPGLVRSENDRETRSFQYFYERTVPSLAGYCGSAFWNRLVLQVSQHEKSVWHALVALGALHENFEKNEDGPATQLIRQTQDSFAIQEYVAAIRALLNVSDNLDFNPSTPAFTSSAMNLTVDVCLVSCILFVCFEILSGHYVSAINHIRSGMKILREAYYDPRSGTYRHPLLKPSTVTKLEMETLRSMFFRLQSQTLTLTRIETDKPLYNIIEQPSLVQIEIPECFSSIAEARDIFENYGCLCSHEYHIAVGKLSSAKAAHVSDYLIQKYTLIINKWTAALDRFEQSRGHNLTTKEQVGLKILRMYRLQTIITLASGQSENSNSFNWDQYNSLFEGIISLAASIAGTRFDTDSTFSTNLLEKGEGFYLKPSFTLDNGIIAPLYDTAVLCRDPIIRRKAVHILRSVSRQEGVFNSHVSAMAAEKVIAIEEAAASRLSSDYHDSILSLTTIVSDMNLEQQDHQITKSSDVPKNVRLTYAYPTVDTTKREFFLTIGQEEMRKRKMHIDIPFPAATAVVDIEFKSIQ